MKKVLSLVLSLIMAVCVLPAGVAFAAGSGPISAGQTATVTLDRDGDTYILHFNRKEQANTVLHPIWERIWWIRFAIFETAKVCL